MTRILAAIARLRSVPSRSAKVAATAGPSNLVILIGLVVLGLTIGEEWGRLAGQAYAGLVLVWVGVVLSRSGG